MTKYKMLKNLVSILLGGFLLLSCASSRVSKQERSLHPKREFRGAWIQTVFQDDYRNLSSQQFRTLMTDRLDQLQACGINAIVFQVRPEADAFYPSDLEPWSRFLTGLQGLPPDEPEFDPMAFLIEACHQRNMEFHAWLNPYRAGTSGTANLVEGHVYYQYPEWFVEYNKQLLFDPGVPACRRFICRVVKDIVTRYDVDAIHMDDYFYPYPVAGLPFPDDNSFEQFGRPAGYQSAQRADWRRDNVNQLIQEIKQTILLTKPWVRFGISPFGIYRNQRNDKKGSRTNGLQNYDDLYADVVLWLEKGWIDYCAPQLYWEIGHQAADYRTLIEWWNDLKSDVPLYIGQDVARTMKVHQLAAKMNDVRRLKQVEGNIFWPANELLWNNGGVADSLKRFYHRSPALIPAYINQHKATPEQVKHMRVSDTDKGTLLEWFAPQEPDDPETARYFVVYRFRKGEKKNIQQAEHIYTITREPYCLIPYSHDNSTYTYMVTAVDRFHNESKPGKKMKVKRYE